MYGRDTHCKKLEHHQCIQPEQHAKRDKYSLDLSVRTIKRTVDTHAATPPQEPEVGVEDEDVVVLVDGEPELCPMLLRMLSHLLFGYLQIHYQRLSKVE